MGLLGLMLMSVSPGLISVTLNSRSAASGWVDPNGIRVAPDRVDRWFFTSDLLMRLIETPVVGCLPESCSSERCAGGWRRGMIIKAIYKEYAWKRERAG